MQPLDRLLYAESSSLPSVLTDPAAGYLTDDPTANATATDGDGMERDLLGGSGGALEINTAMVHGRGRRVRRRPGGQRHSSRQRGRRRRRARSETDLRKMR